MTREEALDYIKQCQDYYPPKPTLFWYQDPCADGYQNASSWYKEYPPVDTKLIDSILERDKDCKEYIPDSECETDEKFNQEMEKRFTDLMIRGNKSNSAVEEYRKKNQHLYSMVTEYNYDKITIIPAQLSTLCDFKEKCNKISNEIGLKNYYIYEYKNSDDLDGKMVYGSAPYGGFYLSSGAKDTFADMLRYCDYFKKYAKEYKSSNDELISNLCDNIKECIENLYRIVNVDYLQRINNYIAKESLSVD